MATKINPRSIQKSYSEKIEESLTNQGVPIFDIESGLLDINSEYLSLPSEITEVPSKELGEYLNAYTQQKVYLRTVHFRCSLLVEETRRKYNEVSSSFYMEYSKDKMSETAKERIITSLPEVKPFYDSYCDALQKENIVKLAIYSVEDIIFLLSREVTRRTGDFKEDSRNQSVSNR